MSDPNVALVIAGGTEEPIDDVRVLTNRSTGRLGAAIANELTRQGHRVYLMASPSLCAHPEWLDDSVTVIPFSHFRSLEVALADFARNTKTDLVFMAAAVADYSPIRQAGKLSSDADELLIHLQRNPKLLGRLRDQFGAAATLVGFKLLSGVSEEELIAVAAKQVHDNRLDLCVANDATLIQPDHHPVILVHSREQIERASGSKAEIANKLVQHVLQRMA